MVFSCVMITEKLYLELTTNLDKKNKLIKMEGKDYICFY